MFFMSARRSKAIHSFGLSDFQPHERGRSPRRPGCDRGSSLQTDYGRIEDAESAVAGSHDIDGECSTGRTGRIVGIRHGNDDLVSSRVARRDTGKDTVGIKGETADRAKPRPGETAAASAGVELKGIGLSNDGIVNGQGGDLDLAAAGEDVHREDLGAAPRVLLSGATSPKCRDLHGELPAHRLRRLAIVNGYGKEIGADGGRSACKKTVVEELHAGRNLTLGDGELIVAGAASSLELLRERSVTEAQSKRCRVAGKARFVGVAQNLPTPAGNLARDASRLDFPNDLLPVALAALAELAVPFPPWARLGDFGDGLRGAAPKPDPYRI